MVSTDTIVDVEKNRNHPLYLLQSDTPGSSLTTIQLTGVENYSLWSRSMLLTLRAKSKAGFVFGTCKKSDNSTALEEQWEKCNAFVLSWILNSVSKELMSGIIYATDAATVWADLKERFDKVDGSRGYQLHREICTITQGTSSVSAYFTRLRLLWDEFDALVAPPSCGCDKSMVYASHLQYMKLFAFLMGLNESYNQARSQILMMIPLPSVNKAYSMIISDESQRMTAGSYQGGVLAPPTALYAGKNHHRQFVGNDPYSGGQFVGNNPYSGGQIVGNNPYSGGDVGASTSTALYAGRGHQQSSYKQKRDYTLQCEVCKLKGHTKETCYRVVGYPPDYKFKKKFGAQPERFGNQGNRMANVNVVEDDSLGSASPTFTQEQYGQILRLLNKEHTDAPVVNQAGPVNWEGQGDW